MKRAAEKLNSRRGASLLLALVFVLVCVTVGISILSAAASNAGRTRSNHEEQQLYLSLSSALQLVADDLSNASYTPKVNDTCSESSSSYEAGVDEDGTPIMITITTYTHTFKPVEKGDMDECLLEDLFQKKLDVIFNDYMHKKAFSLFNSSSGNVKFEYTGQNNFPPAASEVQSFTLTVEPEDLPVETDKDTYHAARKVAVDVAIDKSYRITLTAHLTDGDTDADSYAKSFRLSTVLTRSSASLPDITLPTYGTNGTTIPISASPAVTWKQGVVESSYVDGGAAP